MKRHWTQHEKSFLFDNIHNLALPEIARELNRNERTIKLFLHRNRHNPRLCKRENNLLIRLLERKMKDVACFQPNRAFFDAVQIGQKRYWAIYKGLETIKDEELKRIADYLEISLEEIYTLRQTTLF